MLCAHILTSVGWFGVAVVVAFCGLLAVHRGRRAAAGALPDDADAPWLSIPMGLAAVATGVVLGLGTTFGLVRNWWVVAKIAISAAVVVTDAVLVGRAAHDALVTGRAPVPLYGSTIAHVVMLAVRRCSRCSSPGVAPPGPADQAMLRR